MLRNLSMWHIANRSNAIPTNPSAPPPFPTHFSPIFHTVLSGSLMGAYVKLLVKEGTSLVPRPFTSKPTFQLQLQNRIRVRDGGGTE